MDSVDSIGLVGGLVVIWKKDIKVKVIDKCFRFIEIEVEEEKDSSFWSCLLVYGELDSNLISHFYEDILVKIKSSQPPHLHWGLKLSLVQGR